MNKLTNETLFDAIGELDEDLIAEARETEAAPAKKASRFPLRRALSLAACFAAVFAVSALLLISPLSLSDQAQGENIDVAPYGHEVPGEPSETGLDFSHEQRGDETGKQDAEVADEPTEKVPEEDAESPEKAHGDKPCPTADTKSAERIEASAAEKSAEPGESDRENTGEKKQDDAPTCAEDGKNGTDARKWLKVGIAAGIAALVTAIFMIAAKQRNGKDRK